MGAAPRNWRANTHAKLGENGKQTARKVPPLSGLKLALFRLSDSRANDNSRSRLSLKACDIVSHSGTAVSRDGFSRQFLACDHSRGTFLFEAEILLFPTMLGERRA
jgi:hypothetical protein